MGSLCILKSNTNMAHFMLIHSSKIDFNPLSKHKTANNVPHHGDAQHY